MRIDLKTERVSHTHLTLVLDFERNLGSGCLFCFYFIESCADLRRFSRFRKPPVLDTSQEFEAHSKLRIGWVPFTLHQTKINLNKYAPTLTRSALLIQ
jgi:hypothetical protein